MEIRTTTLNAARSALRSELDGLIGSAWQDPVGHRRVARAAEEVLFHLLPDDEQAEYLARQSKEA